MNDHDEYQWPKTFWPKFIDQFWQKNPTSFRCPAKQSFVNLLELFEIVTQMPSRTPSDRFWIVQNDPPKTISDFRMGVLDLIGPQQSDGHFDGYFERLKDHRAGINIHNLNAAMPTLPERVTDFAKHLSNVDGVSPVKSWALDTFFGTYYATPFGIHRDNASVFSFILLGERTYATWPADYFSPEDDAIQTPDMDKINLHLPNAEMFTVRPGEIFYWPSNRWHVALSNGEPSVVAQISAYFDQADLDQIHGK